MKFKKQWSRCEGFWFASFAVLLPILLPPLFVTPSWKYLFEPLPKSVVCLENEILLMMTAIVWCLPQLTFVTRCKKLGKSTRVGLIRFFVSPKPNFCVTSKRKITLKVVALRLLQKITCPYLFFPQTNNCPSSVIAAACEFPHVIFAIATKICF